MGATGDSAAFARVQFDGATDLPHSGACIAIVIKHCESFSFWNDKPLQSQFSLVNCMKPGDYVNKSKRIRSKSGLI